MKIFNNSNVNDERQGRDRNGLVKKFCGSEDFFEMDVLGSHGVTLQFRYKLILLILGHIVRMEPLIFSCQTMLLICIFVSNSWPLTSMFDLVLKCSQRVRGSKLER